MRTLLTILTVACMAMCSFDAFAKNDETRPPRTGFSISLERTACFGTCPIYRVRITGDGRVTFDGERFVAAMGHHERRITRAAVERLRRQVETSGFFGFRSHYEPRSTDSPSLIISVTNRGRARTVRADASADMPRALPGLADAIDQAAGTAQWVGHR